MNVKNTENEIYFNFSYFALRLLGKGLYSNPWTAIAELVANGFDAKADNVKIYINAVNKEKSVIEIFDNGYGMGYDDLASKYTLIGRDKRDDNTLDEETKSQLMGRKGIGKLAGLYLSKKYYLISKTEKEGSAWCLDAKNSKDSDIPKLDRVLNLKTIKIESEKFWNENKTGTMIKLTDVDLRNFGDQSLKGLKARLADFFLLDSLPGKMEIAFLKSRNESIIFEKIEKEIAYKNMCAIFDNSPFEIKNKLSKTVFLRSPIKEISKVQCNVEIIDEKKFENLSGERCFIVSNGIKSEDGIPYKMSGWIGIHATIDKKGAIVNDKNFLRNKTYNPNQLRLYVRKKLAVENFLGYLENTQAFNNYIEGEISFDILDDDRLEDIATTSRQDFETKNDRVQLLIEILKPIVNALIRQRVKLGETVALKEQEYYEEQERIAKQKEEAERKRAENAEQAQKQAEKERDKANEGKVFAEKRAEEAENAKKETEQQLQKRLEQLRVVTSLSSQDLEAVTNLHHQTNIAALDIQEQILDFSRLHKGKDCVVYEDLSEFLQGILFEDSKIISYSQFGIKKIFDNFNTKADYDIIEFIENYIDKIAKSFAGKTRISISFINNVHEKFITKFAPIDISIIIDNMISNAKKARATTLNIECCKAMDCLLILFTSNNPFDSSIKNLNVIFEKGFSTTRSTGVGLYHIRNIVSDNKWTISAECFDNCARFVIKIIGGK
jgi:hypothetical protein